MGSAIKKQSTWPALVIGLIIIGLIAFAIVRFMSGGGGSDEESSLKTPPPRPGSKDFGPIDPQYQIGNTPGGPSGPGRGR